jgi:hypothetical protein
MKKFKVILTRSYAVKISADNIESAKGLTEFHIGDPKDESNIKEQKNFNFQIGDMEMVLNEAWEAEEIIA